MDITASPDVLANPTKREGRGRPRGRTDKVADRWRADPDRLLRLRTGYDAAGPTLSRGCETGRVDRKRPVAGPRPYSGHDQDGAPIPAASVPAAAAHPAPDGDRGRPHDPASSTQARHPAHGRDEPATDRATGGRSDRSGSSVAQRTRRPADPAGRADRRRQAERIASSAPRSLRARLTRRSGGLTTRRWTLRGRAGAHSPG